MRRSATRGRLRCGAPARWLLALFLSALCANSPAAPRTEAGSLESTARQAYHAGRFTEALAQWADAEQLLAEQGDDVGLARVLAHKSAVYAAMGRLTDALDAAQRSLELAQRVADPALLVTALSALGNARLMRGEGDLAEGTLREAMTLAETVRLPGAGAAATNDLATLDASRGRYAEAAAGYQDAARLADAAGDVDLAVTARVNRARALADAGEAASLAAALADAELRLAAMADSHRKAYALVGVGRLYLHPGLAAPDGAGDAHAERALRAAAASARSVEDARALAYASGYLGELFEQRGRDDEALALTRAAVLAAQRVDAPESLYRWQWQSARLLRRRGDREAALAAYRSAVATLQRVRPDLDAGQASAQTSFREQVGPLYLQLADLLLREAAAEPDGARREARLREARQTVELLKGAELADYFQDDCVAQFYAKTTGIDRLAARTAAVYPIVLEDRTDVLLSLPDGIRLVSVPVDAATMEREVRALRKLLVKRTTHDYLPHARQLYDWLFRPLEPYLAEHQVDTLVMVPDGPLRTVPMAALHDGNGFLAERFAVATTPGLTLTDPRPIPREDLRMLVVALTESVQGFGALPDVEAELSAIAALYGGTVLRDADFVVPSVERELTGKLYSVVHVASHAQFDRDLTNTFLLTYESRLTMDSLAALIGVTAFRDEPVELLTLSACETAAGDDRAALGLAGVAVKSGARSALATLWYINDRASSVLVSKFYRNLKSPGLSKAEALRRAQRELLDDRFYRHPYYWSPFLMIGNWL